MAFMMPVVKNDWDIYNSQRSRRISEGQDKGRTRKVSESRSEGPTMSPRSMTPGMSPHRSAPTMRSLSYSRPPTSRASLRPQDSPARSSAVGGGGSTPKRSTSSGDKFHNRLVDKLKKALGRSSNEERSS